MWAVPLFELFVLVHEFVDEGVKKFAEAILADRHSQSPGFSHKAVRCMMQSGTSELESQKAGSI
jgi:hypothetical protein